MTHVTYWCLDWESCWLRSLQAHLSHTLGKAQISNNKPSYLFKWKYSGFYIFSVYIWTLSSHWCCTVYCCTRGTFSSTVANYQLPDFWHRCMTPLCAKVDSRVDFINLIPLGSVTEWREVKNTNAIIWKHCLCVCCNRAVKPVEGKVILTLRQGKNLSAGLSTSSTGPVHTSPTHCILYHSFSFAWFNFMN